MSMIRALNTPYTKFNNPHVEGYDSSKPITYGLFLDVNSLYPTVMSQKSPTGPYETLSMEENEPIKWEDVPSDGEYTYILLVDFHIPDDVKRKTDDFPLAIYNKVCHVEDQSSYTKDLIEKKW